MNKKLAMATSADMRKVEGNLEEVNLSFETFDAVITAHDVVHKKPAPDIFLEAASAWALSQASALLSRMRLTA